MRERLHHRRDAPLHVRHDFPPLHGVAIDRHARRAFVRGVEVVAVAEAAYLARAPEAPRTDAEPRKVLPRIADVRDLPVDDGAHTLRTDDEISVAEVAVHERDAL